MPLIKSWWRELAVFKMSERHASGGPVTMTQFVTIGGLVTHFVDHYQPVQTASEPSGFFLPTRRNFLLNHSHAAIDVQRLASDVCRLVARKIKRSRGNLV